ncbi:hypothetical protein J2W32_001470 [Variovorax boronicumulans]|uniref:Uncharacterized protein n=1 Tax=Variovorax boronicumulans TaxID=436515 RepID=A0AAW8D1T7_9BURK|nr:hypothetical protein [Variovorax boronicumulans]MDP9893225.1 hypothetical protein [Variovorax boronicumulans]MDQ0052428.1 hypothetical protein [Variovorax boronicumulans]
MFGIDDPTAVAVLPTPELPGTPGFFTEGNPALGQAATYVRASWLNALQQELLNILTAAGVTPSKTTYNQLLTSLNTLYKGRLLRTLVYTRIAGVQNVSINGAAPTTTGAGTYVPGAGATFILAEAQGGGNAAAGASLPTAGNISLGSPGGAGAYGKSFFLVSTVGASQTITVGAAGAPVTGAAGGVGSSSSIGSLLTAPGGIGSAPLNNFPAANNANGNNSLTAAPSGANLVSVKGGCGALSLVVNTGVTTGILGGPGGASQFGLGGVGLAANTTGSAASGNWGSGGGGVALTSGAGAAVPGGAATDGAVIIQEFA